MSKASQTGAVVIDVVLGVALIASIIFGIWAFSQSQTYKSDYNKKVDAAVAAREKTLEQQAQDKIDSLNLKQFKGSATYGTITFDYPKTWSAYVDTSDASEPINAYFYPGEVPGVQSGTAYALRVELVSTSYADVLQQLTSQLNEGQAKATVFMPQKLAKNPSAQPGTRFDGDVGQDSSGNAQKGSKIIITVRDKTLQISTESPNFLSDFNDVVLPSLTYIP